jgi:hypothetical protein
LDLGDFRENLKHLEEALNFGKAVKTTKGSQILESFEIMK